MATTQTPAPRQRPPRRHLNLYRSVMGQMAGISFFFFATLILTASITVVSILLVTFALVSHSDLGPSLSILAAIVTFMGSVVTVCYYLLQSHVRKNKY